MREQYISITHSHNKLVQEIENIFCHSDYSCFAAQQVNSFENSGACYACLVICDEGDTLTLMDGKELTRLNKNEFVNCLPILFSQCEPQEMSFDDIEEFLSIACIKLESNFEWIGRIFGVEIAGGMSAYFVAIYHQDELSGQASMMRVCENEQYIIETINSTIARNQSDELKCELKHVQKERTIWLESLLWLSTSSDELENTSYDKFYSEALFQLTVLVKSDEATIHRVGVDGETELSLLNTLGKTGFSDAIKKLFEYGVDFKKNEFYITAYSLLTSQFDNEYSDVVIYPVYFNDKLVMLVSLAKRDDNFEKNQLMFAGLFCLSIQKTLEKRNLLQSISNKNKKLEKEKEEQAALIQQLHDTQDQLFQQEKMASIGQLAAGVAHEINNPVGYVNSNIGALEEYIVDLCEATSSLMKLQDSEHCSIPLKEAIQEIAKRLDLSYIHEDSQALVTESKEGILRVKQIVQDLKDFSHVDEAVWQMTDVTQGINSTLNIVANELKYKAKVIKKYEDIPAVECVASQINQVIMNLLVNAGHAIKDNGVITISAARHDSSNIKISIKDNGCGIDDEALSKIFNPFYTTKPIGKGTGLGLSLSYSIVEKHGGKLLCSSVLGEGTTFDIILPIKQQESYRNEVLDV